MTNSNSPEENRSEENEAPEGGYNQEPGQEQHLPHEAWHVVQEKRRRPRPMSQDEENSDNETED